MIKYFLSLFILILIGCHAKTLAPTMKENIFFKQMSLMLMSAWDAESDQWKLITTDQAGNYFGCLKQSHDGYRKKINLWISSDSCSSPALESYELGQIVEWEMTTVYDKKGKAIELHVMWEENNEIQKKKLIFPLINIRKKMQEMKNTQKHSVMSEQKVYASHVHLKPYAGLWVLYPIQNTAASTVINSTQNICHEVDSECKTTREYSCQRCDGVISEIFFPGCESGGVKICTYANCGISGQLACFRGRAYKQLEATYPCDFFEESYFCQRGLELSCEGDRVYCR